ncbi:hypothetical protein SBADM41S_12014 [Streptomyces badius]
MQQTVVERVQAVDHVAYARLPHEGALVAVGEGGRVTDEGGAQRAGLLGDPGDVVDQGAWAGRNPKTSSVISRRPGRMSLVLT